MLERSQSPTNLYTDEEDRENPHNPADSANLLKVSASDDKKKDSLSAKAAKEISLKLLNRFKEIKKDFIDTFKPYKSGNSYIIRDVVLPLYGLFHLAIAVVMLIYAPCRLLFDIGRSIIKAIRARSFNPIIKGIPPSFAANLVIISLATTSILQNALKVAAAPFIWFLRMPLRGLLSLTLGRPTLISSLKPKAEVIEVLIKEKNKNLKEDPNIIQKMAEIKAKLDKSYDKCLKKGQQLEVTKKTLDDAFNNYEAAATRSSEASLIPHIQQNNSEKADAANCSALQFLSIFTKHPVPTNTSEEEEEKELALDVDLDQEALGSDFSPISPDQEGRIQMLRRPSRINT